MQYVNFTANVVMRLALLNVAILFILASSCKPRIDYANRGEFHYYNRLSAPVLIEVKNGLNKAYETYNIAPGGSIVIHTSHDGPKVAKRSGYLPGLYADTTTIRMFDTLCYIEDKSSRRMLFDIDAYDYEKRGDADYVFRFDIDSTLYKLAGKCE